MASSSRSERPVVYVHSLSYCGVSMLWLILASMYADGAEVSFVEGIGWATGLMLIPALLVVAGHFRAGRAVRTDDRMRELETKVSRLDESTGMASDA